jgi:hypothetical protein
MSAAALAFIDAPVRINPAAGAIAAAGAPARTIAAGKSLVGTPAVSKF